MIKVAIVEDSIKDANKISDYVDKFFESENLEYKTERFSDGMNFIDKIKSNFDIVLLDIKMPLLDGMSTAKKIREAGLDSNIIFVTDMVQYAISGYEVDAVAYLVKPVAFYNFVNVMKKVISKIRLKENKGKDIIITSKQNGVKIISPYVLKYVEVMGHELYFYTEDGIFCCHRKTLKEITALLPAGGFAYCSSHCVVNMKYIACIKANRIILLDKTELDLTRGKKNKFIERFMAFVR